MQGAIHAAEFELKLRWSIRGIWHGGPVAFPLIRVVTYDLGFIHKSGMRLGNYVTGCYVESRTI